MIYVVVGIVVGLVAVVAFVRYQRRPETGVDRFRRHIDALSPDARREVMDRVRSASEQQAKKKANDNGS